jgi:hypothetical protein
MLHDHVIARSGELYPCETDVRLCEELRTGEEVEVDMEKDVLTVLSSGREYPLKPLGEVKKISPSNPHRWPYKPVGHLLSNAALLSEASQKIE